MDRLTNEIYKIVRDIQPEGIPTSVYEEVAKAIPRPNGGEPDSEKIYKILESYLEDDKRYSWSWGYSEKAIVAIYHKLLETIHGDLYSSAELAKMNRPYIHLYESLDSSCLLYTSPSPRDRTRSRMPSSA